MYLLAPTSSIQNAPVQSLSNPRLSPHQINHVLMRRLIKSASYPIELSNYEHIGAIPVLDQ